MKMLFRMFLLLCMFFPLPVLSAESDFDKMCHYFEELDNTSVINKMSSSQKAEFISKRITKNLKADSAARQTWEVVIYAVPEERYEMVKSTATELLKTKWQCNAMKKHISKTGD